MSRTHTEEKITQAAVWECEISSSEFKLSLLGCVVLTTLGIVPVAHWLFAIELVSAISIGLACSASLFIWQEISPAPESKKTLWLFKDRLEVSEPGGIRIGKSAPTTVDFETIDPSQTTIKFNPLANGGRVIVRARNGKTLRAIDFPSKRLARQFVTTLARLA